MRVVQAEDLYRLKSVANPQLSPDGHSFVYVVTTIDREADAYTSHLFFQELDSDESVQWTFGTGNNHTPRWSPDGSSVAFVSNRSGKNQLYVLRVNGGEARQLTFLPGGASNPVWSPDGTKLAFTTSLPPGSTVADKEEKQADQPVPLEVTQMKYKSDAAGFWNGNYAQAAMVDVANGTLTQLTDARYDVRLYSWSPDGAQLAVGANISEDQDLSFHQDVLLLDVASKELQSVTGGRGYFEHAVWSPDGTYVAMTGHERTYENATLPKLWLYDTAAGTLCCHTASWDVPVGDLMIGDFQQGAAAPAITWADDSSLYCLVTEQGSTNLYTVGLNGDIQPMYTGEQHFYGLSIHSASQTAVAAISTPTEIGDLYLLSLGDECLSAKLTAANEDFALSKPEAFTYAGAKGWEVQGWLMKPAGFEEGKKYPLVLEIHGGPHAMYGNTYMNEFQILAGKGYAVLYVNPRGSHGYGQAFVDAVRGDYGGGDYEDVMLAVDHVLANYDFIDEARLAVTGGSYGGFLTNWIVGHTNRFKAAVTQRSISNWISFYGVSDIGYYFTEWQVAADLGDVDTLWKHSPLAYVKQVETPLLILHSEKDYRCPIEQGEQLFIALKRLGKETTFIRFPEENHELSRSGRPSLRKSRLDYIVDWFDTYIQ